MRKPRKNYSPAEKVAILKRHLIDKIPISQLCEEHQLQPTVFYNWQKVFFENGMAAFENPKRTTVDARDQMIEQFQAKLQRKDAMLAELLEEHAQLKKRTWGTLKGCWVPHDIRDQIVDFVRRWSDKTEIATFVIVA